MYKSNQVDKRQKNKQVITKYMKGVKQLNGERLHQVNEHSQKARCGANIKKMIKIKQK